MKIVISEDNFYILQQFDVDANNRKQTQKNFFYREIFENINFTSIIQQRKILAAIAD